MLKVQKIVLIDQDVAVELYDIIKQRKLSSLVNNFLREYVGLNKAKTEDLSNADIDAQISKAIAEAERLKQEKTKRGQAEKDKYKNIRFID